MSVRSRSLHDLSSIRRSVSGDIDFRIALIGDIFWSFLDYVFIITKTKYAVRSGKNLYSRNDRMSSASSSKRCNLPIPFVSEHSSIVMLVSFSIFARRGSMNSGFPARF